MSKQLLYFGPSGIGDWCFIYPSLEPLLERFGCDRVTIVVPYANSGNALLAENELVFELLYLHRAESPSDLASYAWRWLALLRKIRAGGYEALVVSYLSNQIDFLVLAALSGIEHRIGRRTRGGFWERRAFRALEIPTHLGKVGIHLAYSGLKHPRPTSVPMLTAEPSTRFDTPYVVLGIGGGRQAYWKFWPPSHYRAVIESLPQTHFVLLGGGADDRAQADKIAGGQQNVTDLVDRTDMREALALLAGATVCVGNDSGLANMARALDIPVLALYGPTSPDLNGPSLLGAKALSIPVPCGPCFGDDQNPETALACDDRICLENLSPETVIAELKTLIEVR